MPGTVEPFAIQDLFAVFVTISGTTDRKSISAYLFGPFSYSLIALLRSTNMSLINLCTGYWLAGISCTIYLFYVLLMSLNVSDTSHGWSTPDRDGLCLLHVILNAVNWLTFSATV